MTDPLGFTCKKPTSPSGKPISTLRECIEAGSETDVSVVIKKHYQTPEGKDGLFFTLPASTDQRMVADSNYKYTLDLMRGIEELTDRHGLKIAVGSLVLSSESGEVPVEQLRNCGLIDRAGYLTRKGNVLLYLIGTLKRAFAEQSPAMLRGLTLNLEAIAGLCPEKPNETSVILAVRRWANVHRSLPPFETMTMGPRQGASGRRSSSHLASFISRSTVLNPPAVNVNMERSYPELNVTARSMGEKTRIPIDVPLPVHTQVYSRYEAEINFYRFYKGKVTTGDTLKPQELTNLVGVLNGLRSNYKGGPVRILVDGRNHTDFPYGMDEIEVAGEKIKYCYVSENGKQVLVVGLTRKQLSNPELAGKISSADFKPAGPAKPREAAPSSAPAIKRALVVGDDSFIGADQSPINARKIKAGNGTYLYVVQVRDPKNATAPILSNFNYDTLLETTAKADYDAGSKTISASFVEGSGKLPARKVHINNLVLASSGPKSPERKLEAGKDYKIGNDGKIKLLLKPGTYKIKVFLRIGPHALSVPAEVTVTIKDWPRVARSTKVQPGTL